MPIYMDRHDVSADVSAEIIAQLHQEDLKMQGQFGCRVMTYWFDDNRKKAFCLIEAPNKDAIKELHAHAHGQVPNHIIEVQTDLVESFLGRIEDPDNPQGTGLNIIEEAAFRIIMVIALSNSLPPGIDSLQFNSSWKEISQDIVKILTEYGGKPVTQKDHRWLVSYRSVPNAVRAALEIRSLFHKIYGNRKSKDISLKIGLTAGQPVTEKKSLFEDKIILAQRLSEIGTLPIVVSSEVKELYENEMANSPIKNEHIIAVSSADEKFLTELMDYLEKVWSDTGLQVEDFCKALGLSKSQLYRKLNTLIEKSPNEFIREWRLKEALKLLQKNTSNVSQVAFETGFSSPSYFSKCFLKRFGHLPSDYLLVQTT
ncbi:MAG: nickel-binding protein [Chitinophagales bacterium]